MGGSADSCETVGQDGTGVDADFVLYVSAVGVLGCPLDEGFESQMIAFSSPCQLEEDYDRYDVHYRVI